MQMHNSIFSCTELGLQGQVKQRKVQLSFCLLTVPRVQYSGCGLTNMPRPKYVNRSPGSRRTSMRGIFGDSFEAVACQSQLISSPKLEKADAWQQRSHLVCGIFTYTLQFSSKVYQRKKKERKKEMKKMEIFARGFLERDKGQWNLYSRFSNRLAKGCSL